VAKETTNDCKGIAITYNINTGEEEVWLETPIQFGNYLIPSSLVTWRAVIIGLHVKPPK
jgi:hypothetical protein